MYCYISSKITLLCLVLLFATIEIKADVICGGGATGWLFDAFEQPPLFDTPSGTNDCPLPFDIEPNLYYCPPSKTQKRPWDAAGDFIVNGPGAGWALDQLYAFGCMKGGWCPYACKAPYIESQFDNGCGQPWGWQTSCNGKDVFVGGGRRTVTCGGNLNGGMCAGGQQGLYCAPNGVAKVNAPSSLPSANPQYISPCILGQEGVELINHTPWEISACRTVFPGSEIPQIPTTVGPNGQMQLVVPPVYSNGKPAWWTAGTTKTAGLQHYLAVPIMDSNSKCIDPICQWISWRPATGAPSVGGIDYTPYILEVSPSANTAVNGFGISVRINSDASLGDPSANADNSYDGSLGNPRYGVRIYDVNGKLVCDAYWTGVPINSDCSTVCRGKRCANKPCAGVDCGQAPPDCNSVRCMDAESAVEPHIITYDSNGNAFQVNGTGLIRACGTFYNIDQDAGKRVRIELYPTDGSTPPPLSTSGSSTTGDVIVTTGEASSTSGDAATTGEASSTTGSEVPSTTGDQGSTTGETAATTGDQGTTGETAATTGDQGSTGETVVTTGDQSGSTGETVITTGDQGSITGETAATTGDQGTTGETPATTGDEGITTGETVITTGDQGTTGETIITTGDEGLTGETPATTGDQGTTGEIVVTTGEQEVTTTGDAGTTGEVVVTTGDQGSTTGETAATADGEGITTADQTAITTGDEGTTNGETVITTGEQDTTTGDQTAITTGDQGTTSGEGASPFCGKGLLRCGLACYKSTEYTCFPGALLCRTGTTLCGRVCYNPSLYGCRNNQYIYRL